MAPVPDRALRAARAEEERAVRSELHAARRAASLATTRLNACASEAALIKHSAAAHAAKQACELERLRSAQSRRDLLQQRSDAQLAEVSSQASLMEELNAVILECARSPGPSRT